MAIRIGPLADSNLLSRKLGTFSYGLFASPVYLKRNGILKTPDELKKHPALVFSRKNHKEFWHLCFENNEVKVYPNARMQSNNLWVLRNAAAAGLGIVFMHKCAYFFRLSCGTSSENAIGSLRFGINKNRLPRLSESQDNVFIGNRMDCNILCRRVGLLPPDQLCWNSYTTRL